MKKNEKKKGPGFFKQLESIQNRAAQFVTGDYERKSSITAMKSSQDWESLQQRRQVPSLTNFLEAVAGRLAIPVRNILRPVERNLRHTSPASNSFIPIATNKNCYKFLFIPRTIVNWNNVPENITSIQDKDQFKQAVKGCFTIRVHLQKLHSSPVLTVEAYFDFKVLLPKH